MINRGKLTQIKFAPLALALALAGVAAPAVAQTPPPPPPREAKTTAMAYVMAAGAADRFEIQSSQLAMAKSPNAATKRFAQMLVTDHQETTAATMEAVKEAGMDPAPPMLDPGAQASITELRNASAGDFDRLYVGQQVPAHQAALDLHQSYSTGGDQAPLRMSAKSAIPAVKRHLADAQKMMARSPGTAHSM